MSDNKFKEGHFILLGDEYFKILENYWDKCAKVVDKEGTIIGSFYFQYGDEMAQIVTDEQKIELLENSFNKH
ncbi:hypothetical protein [Bacillus solimangrovi]|nr:hypothetical protein [Bacillus solimangrovi]